MADPRPNSRTQARAPTSSPRPRPRPAAIALATRMYDAARQGDAELLQHAIAAGVPPNLTNEKGDTLVCLRPVETTTPRASVDSLPPPFPVLLLLSSSSGPSSAHRCGAEQDSRLTKNQVMLAAYHGHADLVRFLVQHGADPNRLNDRGQSPLAGAVFKKEDQVIQVRVAAVPENTSTKGGQQFRPRELYPESQEWMGFMQILKWTTGFARCRCGSRAWHAVGGGVHGDVQAGGDVERQV